MDTKSKRNTPKTYIAKDANRRLREHLQIMGRDVQLVATEGIVEKALSNHPDMFLCKLGLRDDAPVWSATGLELSPGYPKDCAFNAACTGKYFIHNLAYTEPSLLAAAKEMGLVLIDVKQGYAKCSTVIVTENAIITSDEGIAKACEPYEDLEVLLVQPGHVRLEGYNSGFLGGASGRVGRELIFNGNLLRHPDFTAILDFVEGHGLTCKWFPEYQLTDIGSIL